MNDSVKVSFGIHNSYTVYGSYGVNGSRGVCGSYGIYDSSSVYDSRAINNSDAVYGSCGIFNSRNVQNSFAVYNSFGVHNSTAVSDSLFVSHAQGESLLFNKKITIERMNEVKTNFNRLIGTWIPYFNNAHELWEKNQKDWEKVDPSQIRTVDKKTAHLDMPMPLINYLKSLPEFDAKVFEEVTGIDVSKDFGKN